MRCAQCKAEGDLREVFCRNCGYIRPVDRPSMVPLVIVCCVFLAFGVLGFAGYYSARQAFRPDTPGMVRNDLRALHPIVEKYRIDHPGSCPTVDALLAEKEISEYTAVTDPWGSKFFIECEENDTIIRSLGPDKRPLTKDDIRVPDSEPTESR